VKDIQALEGLLAAKMPLVAIESHEEARVLLDAHRASQGAVPAA